MKKTLCLDFDGVLCDSAVECLVAGYNAYFEKEAGVPDDIAADLREYFLKYRYLVGPANDFVVLFRAFEEGAEPLNRASYDAMRETIKELREDFGPKFFASRERLKADLAGWLALHSLFDQSLAVLDFDFPPFFVVTTKDENSVMRLAEFNGYNDKILGVYGKEVATDKRISFQKLFADRNELQPPENYIFVDDNIVHLQQVSDLSVQCWLASWGYVDPEAIGEFPQLDSLADLKKVVD